MRRNKFIELAWFATKEAFLRWANNSDSEIFVALNSNLKMKENFWMGGVLRLLYPSGILIAETTQTFQIRISSFIFCVYNSYQDTKTHSHIHWWTFTQDQAISHTSQKKAMRLKARKWWKFISAGTLKFNNRRLTGYLW